MLSKHFHETASSHSTIVRSLEDPQNPLKEKLIPPESNDSPTDKPQLSHSTRCTQWTYKRKHYLLLWMTIAVGVASEVSELILGAVDNGNKNLLGFIPNTLPVQLGVFSFYALQALNLNGTYILNAIKELYEIGKHGNYPEDWPVFRGSPNRKRLALFLSFICNAYGCFADCISVYFYMIELGLGMGSGIAMVFFTAFLYALTEGLELHKAILGYFNAPSPEEERKTGIDRFACVIATILKTLNACGELLFGFSVVAAVLAEGSVGLGWFFLIMSTTIAMGDFFYGGKFTSTGLLRFGRAFKETVTDIFYYHRVPEMLPIVSLTIVTFVASLLANFQSELMLKQIYDIQLPFSFDPVTTLVLNEFIIPLPIYLISYGTAASQGVNYILSFYDHTYSLVNKLFCCSKPTPENNEDGQDPQPPQEIKLDPLPPVAENPSVLFQPSSGTPTTQPSPLPTALASMV